MPEFQFKNPILEAISHSILRMNKKMDFFIFKLFFFFYKNRRFIMQDPTAIPSTSTQSDEYLNPISLKSFSEFRNPVLDSEGYVREKDENKINFGIYSRKPVEIIESSDLKKIHKDCLSMEEKMDAMMERMDNVMKAWGNDKQKWEREKQERERRWNEERENMHSENKEIVNELRSEIKILKSEINGLKIENEKLKNQLQNNSLSFSDTEYSDIDEEVLMSKSAPEFRLPDEAKWTECNRWLGMKHTFSPIFSDKYKKEEKGQMLKLRAYHGNKRNLEYRLRQDKTLINTRGMPDSLGSLWLGMGDKTPLMIAAKHGHLDIVTKLVEAGAHVNFLDRKSRSALDYAELSPLKHRQEMIDFLKQNDAKNGCEIKDLIENPVLHSSAPSLQSCR